MLTTRNKIRFALLIVGLLSLITSIVSLTYMNNMTRRIQDIIIRDAMILTLSRDISIKILDARREEKNFIIFLDKSYIQNTNIIIVDIMANIDEIKNLAPEHLVDLDSMNFFLDQYNIDINALAEIFEEDPKALDRLQKQFIEYEERLRKTTGARSVSPDSGSEWIIDLNLLIASASTKISAEKSRLLARLRDNSDRVFDLAQKISNHGQTMIKQHGDEGIRFGILAQRNSMVIFIITGLLLVYLLFSLPRYIMAPFTKIMKVLGSIGRGDTSVTLPSFARNDEFEKLYDSFQDAIQKLRQYNELKTTKIIEMKKQLINVLDEIREGAVIFNGKWQVTYINESAQKLFGVDDSIVNKNIGDVKLLELLVKENRGEAESGKKVIFSSRIKSTDLKKRNVFLAPIIGDNNIINVYVLLIK